MYTHAKIKGRVVSGFIMTTKLCALHTVFFSPGGMVCALTAITHMLMCVRYRTASRHVMFGAAIKFA